ncbi:hypothetical protein KUH32_01335 [Thalassococcus sp. CAU 1522]|uniref:Response regulatory domain-containing protein n=1 Tax=Thalassococcus arenae TaxID=2851652 RepID=A0ABS6N488_9RHOB|nr:hypothetical protein [Thalassococcus arenae]MBV2358404.1 hypothetical protein [Thalassococcus arenae]
MANAIDSRRARAFILTENALEAMDIAEFLQSKGVDRIGMATTVSAATALVIQAASPPALVMFGFPLSGSEARDCLAAIRYMGWPTIVVNGHSVDPASEGLPILARPFSTADLDHALRSVRGLAEDTPAPS